MEYYRIVGMAHEKPIDVASGYGRSAAYLVGVGISATVHIARGWGLIPSFERIAGEPAKSGDPGVRSDLRQSLRLDGIQEVIGGSLKAAGLMK